jgi:hypothetical protein
MQSFITLDKLLGEKKRDNIVVTLVASSGVNTLLRPKLMRFQDALLIYPVDQYAYKISTHADKGPPIK